MARKKKPDSHWPERLRKLRKDKKWTQTDAAQACGVTARAWQAYEGGDYPPSLPVQRLIEIFENSVK